jgi:hypothetical protein
VFAVQPSAFVVLGFPFGGGGDVSAWAETCRRVGVLQSCSCSSSSSIASPTSRTTTITTTRTIRLSQPTFDRQRSTIKIENESEHDWGRRCLLTENRQLTLTTAPDTDNCPDAGNFFKRHHAPPPTRRPAPPRPAPPWSGRKAVNKPINGRKEQTRKTKLILV